MNEMVPTFLESEFQFRPESKRKKFLEFIMGGRSRENVPQHIEARPIVPTYVGAFAIYGATRQDEAYTLAVDVPDEKMARQLAKARQRRQEADEELRGYTEDVYILFPNGTDEKIYHGHPLNK